jgi:hypothetical protein
MSLEEVESGIRNRAIEERRTAALFIPEPEKGRLQKTVGPHNADVLNGTRASGRL